jgi:type IV pilus assembly protein PilA
MRADEGVSSMNGHRAERGFTLVEMMIVVLIIAMLILIAIPLFGSSSDKAESKACLSNERQVETAYASKIASDGVEAAATMTDWDSLMTRLVPAELPKVPVCPSGGTYTWSNTNVTCSVHGSYH